MGHDAALDAFARRSPDHLRLLQVALTAVPDDPALILAEAEALAEAGTAQPFARLEAVLAQNAGWAAGHKALAQLRIAFGHDKPLAGIEAALRLRKDDPALWLAWLNLLAAQERHAEAAEQTAALRARIGEVPGLRLLEARFAGLAGDPARAAVLLAGLPDDLPDLAYQRARNALQRGAVEEAAAHIAQTGPGDDMRMWAMQELCWRALGDARHDWLLHDGELVAAFDLGLSEGDILSTAEALRALHRTSLAPPLQSLRGGTQTRGNLHRQELPALATLFAGFANALDAHRARTATLDPRHPLAALAQRAGAIIASWSVRLASGGFHIPHLHDHGLLSSACHLVVPDTTDEGLLELGHPPADIALTLEPLASFAPEPGRLIVFPSFLYHATTPFGAGERLSAVFDAR